MGCYMSKRRSLHFDQHQAGLDTTARSLVGFLLLSYARGPSIAVRISGVLVAVV